MPAGWHDAGVLERDERSSRRFLLSSIAVGAVGTGLFLPIELLYLIRVVGLPTATAGLTMTTATALSLVFPAVTGAMVDRFGSARTFLVARCAQVVGVFGLLWVEGVVGAFLATMCVTAGLRMFWSSVFAVVSDVVAEAEKERSFALTGMAESAGVAAGGFLASLALAVGDPAAYWVLVACNAGLFVLSTLLVTVGVRAPVRRGGERVRRGGYREVLGHGSFVGFVVVSIPPTLAVSLFARVLPVYAVGWLEVPSWVPGALLGWVTAVAAFARARVVRAAVRLSRSRVLLVSTVVLAVWSVGVAAACWVPEGLLVGYLFVLTVPYMVAELLYGPVANALVDALAPAELQGRYLAGFQYTFGVSDALAPALAALLVVFPVLPWFVACAGLVVSALLMPPLFRRFPDAALRRGSTAAGAVGRGC